MENDKTPLTNNCSFAGLSPIMMQLPYPAIQVAEKNKAYAALLSVDYCGSVSEMTAIAQYLSNESYLSCVNCSVARTLLGIAMSEMVHLQKLGELIILLGGDIDFVARYNGGQPRPWNPVYMKITQNAREIIMSAIQSERSAINQYKSHIKMMKDSYVNAVLLRIIRDEEYHIMLLQAMMNDIK